MLIIFETRPFLSLLCTYYSNNMKSTLNKGKIKLLFEDYYASLFLSEYFTYSKLQISLNISNTHKMI